jgi:hypothetical protein
MNRPDVDGYFFAADPRCVLKKAHQMKKCSSSSNRGCISPRVDQSTSDQNLAGPHRPPDLTVSGGGTIFLFHPLGDSAQDWLDEHCPADGEHQYLGSALAVEHRYIDSTVQLAVADGLFPSGNVQL